MIDFIGKVCVCSLGRVGVVTGQRQLFGALRWYGIGLDGKGLWCSAAPIKIADTLADYVERVVERPGNLLYGQVAVQVTK